MAELEGADKPISLARAAELSGIDPGALRIQVRGGKLGGEKIGRNWTTTRRQLHRYLSNRRPGGRPVPLPPGYQTPEGEEPIG
jgi:hypothetical protein